MKIFDLRINRIECALGVDASDAVFSFKADCDGEFTVSVTDRNGSGQEKKVTLADSTAVYMDAPLRKGERYTLSVACGDSAASCDFETGIDLDAPFIAPVQTIESPMLERGFDVMGPVDSARLFITGLGLYRAILNGERVGDWYLTPGCNDYGACLRYQTYDVTPLLREDNTLQVYMGDGWYSGRFGIEPGGGAAHRFGSGYLLCARLVIRYADGAQEVIDTDESWTARKSPCVGSSIYDGERHDYTRDVSRQYACRTVSVDYNVVPHFGAPITVRRVLRPRLYRSPKGEQILDFCQNMVGFVRFCATLPAGKTVRLLHGEVLQDGCFYNANLRTARAEAVYTSDGETRIYEPYFTYFGFRYVLVEGLDEVNPSEFDGVVISAETEETMSCETASDKLNRLISNAIWGQRGNFLDVPTDCPQRDERLGWTADTQVFAATACYNMDCREFYRKYMRDLRADQTMYYGGDIPAYSPSVRGEATPGGAVWSDCAVILPWTVWLAYGDRGLLRENYEMMRDYSEVLIDRDAQQGGRGLIAEGFTFGDWLALDGVSPQSMAGGTDNGFIMSVYYYYALSLTAQAAATLGIDDAPRYAEQARRIRSAVLDEYFAPSGRLSVTTQTAFVLALKYGIFRDRHRIVSQLRERLAADFYKMKCGFTGAPLMLPVLFDNGLDDDAYRILFNEEYPGWLYAVNLGATTIWERWNSLLPDGKISGIMMNSLNHYAYGSVCEAIYSRIAGLRCDAPGWSAAIIEPHPNYRLRNISLRFDSPHGGYAVSWRIEDNGKFSLDAAVPAGCTAQVILPDGSKHEVAAGHHSFCVTPLRDYLHPFDLSTPIVDLLANEDASALLRRVLPQAYAVVTGENPEFTTKPAEFLGALAMFGASPEAIKELDGELKKLSL